MTLATRTSVLAKIAHGIGFMRGPSEGCEFVNYGRDLRRLPRDVGRDANHAKFTRDEATGVNHIKYLARDGYTIVDNRW